MGERITWQQPLTDIAFLKKSIVGVDLLDTFLAQSDVENLEPSYEYLVLREEERQFLLLECECLISMNDVGTDVIGVVFRHES